VQVLGVYAQKVGQLDQALNDPAIRTEAAEVLRTLIDRIELRPEEKGQGIAATLYGDLAQILAICDDPDRKQKLVQERTGLELRKHV
jgi:hypothetical protein